MTNVRPLTKMFLLVLFLVAIVSCTRNDTTNPPASPPPSPDASGGPSRTEPGVPGPLAPRAQSSKGLDRDVSTGQEVFITDKGFVPALLYAVEGAEIRIVNETDETREIKFVNMPIELEPIAPGKYGSFAPDGTVSIVFELVGSKDERGRVQVSAYYEPGETAAPDDSRD